MWLVVVVVGGLQRSRQSAAAKRWMMLIVDGNNMTRSTTRCDEEAIQARETRGVSDEDKTCEGRCVGGGGRLKCNIWEGDSGIACTHLLWSFRCWGKLGEGEQRAGRNQLGGREQRP